MKVGDLCRVLALNSHKPSTHRDLVTITIVKADIVGVIYTVYNTRLGKLQHYTPRELEKIK
mgnify:CR=1 FL=1|jgi:hypothetical protein|tara:strand:- start:186 stop:368 length:183 start_codon:yes stop_codon:yes gene_type:complete